jgi:hypothetical protein
MCTYALLSDEICDALRGLNWYERRRKFQDAKDPNTPHCFVVGAFRSVKF